ncbi:MAG: hypothetical protein CMJ18_03400 [Phycisphaeraceae bacterium]|nr:hypothetical protein [Phycisphaeraceae bacterium]
MKIAMLYGAGDLRLEEHALDTADLAPGDVWVETLITAFKIGTDRGNYEGADPVPGSPEFPRWVGDSNFGVVRGVGADVMGFQVGDRVVSSMHHQSEYVAPATRLVKVPEGVHPEDGVFVNLYSLSAHCYHKAMFHPGENVAVIGLGTLGLGAVAVGPLFGGRVAAIGNSDLRLDMARKMGAHACFTSNDPDLKTNLDAFTDGHGIDLVILTANPWPAYDTSVNIVRDNGRVSIVSLLGRGEADLEFNPLSMERFYIKGISLHAISHHAEPDLFPTPGAGESSQWRHRAHLLTLMAEGRLEPKRLVTHRLHYTRINEAYEMALRREKSMMNVVFDWTDA